MKLILTGWDEDLQKVTLTKLQIKYFGISLKEAKANVDQLLDGKEIEIIIESEEIAHCFTKEAIGIGVLYKIEK